MQRQAAQEPRECALMLRLQMAQVATSGSRLARAHKRKKSLPETKRPPTRFKLQFQPQTEWGGNPKTPGARDSRENSLSTRLILCAREGRLLTRSSFSRAATFFFNSASSPSLISLSLFFAGQPMKGPGRPSISGHDCADLGQYDYDFGHSPLTSILSFPLFKPPPRNLPNPVFLGKPRGLAQISLPHRRSAPRVHEPRCAPTRRRSGPSPLPQGRAAALQGRIRRLWPRRSSSATPAAHPPPSSIPEGDPGTRPPHACRRGRTE